ncbi:MAG: CDP-archaeol synthase [SAR202 cluster bacterium]|nr:CDP-archaeol synthase [SAR202 cluster bacterium]
MALRLATAAFIIPVLLASLWAGGLWFALPTAVLAGVAAIELSRVSTGWGTRPHGPSTALMASAACIWAYYAPVSGTQFTVLGIAATVVAVVSLAWLLVAAPDATLLRRIASTLAVAGFVGGTLLHGPMLRGLDSGRDWLIFLLAVTFASDTGALIVGRVLGRRKLAPAISPGKTWEGAIGGLIGAVVVALAAVALVSIDISYVEVVGFGILLGVLGQAGDLVESKMKRRAGTKDSGSIVPGHGGTWDRLDSIVWNLVVVYHFVS